MDPIPRRPTVRIRTRRQAMPTLRRPPTARPDPAAVRPGPHGPRPRHGRRRRWRLRVRAASWDAERGRLRGDGGDAHRRREADRASAGRGHGRERAGGHPVGARRARRPAGRARYVDEAGVGARRTSSAPAASPTARSVSSSRPSRTGSRSSSASSASSTGRPRAQATALTPGASLGGGLLPLGHRAHAYDSLVDCPIVDITDCVDQNLTSGHLNIPGGFGWLKFGINNGNKCDWGPSLGMIDGGCESSQNFLD